LTVPTAADRLASDLPLTTLTDRRFKRAPGFPSHPSISAIDIRGDDLVISEGEQTLTVRLARTWTDVAGHPIAASAAVTDDGRIHVDLATLSSPHRLEMILDPAKETFTALWPLPPLFGFGFDGYLTQMHPPD